MPISDANTRTLMATYYSTLASHAAFHTANAATSANELTGAGSARGAITWGTASASAITGTATVTAPTAGGNAFGIGLWSALTAGVFRDGQYDIVDITFTTPGTATVTITYTQS